MSEYIRSVAVHVEVDTNKQTYVLDIENAGVEEVQRQYAEFIDQFFPAQSIEGAS